MSSYITLDYLSDLTSSEKYNAGYLAFSPSTSNSNGWDYTANVYGVESYALSHSIYYFKAFEGATYSLFSTSYFDSYFLIVYDLYGNAISINSEATDPALRRFVWDLTSQATVC